ncbi:MAG: esterase, partial [Anaerolineales bacterium]|nr:esterase [Anaerolineales bacterium]
RPEVWERWREHDPLVRLSSAVEPLRSLRLLYLDCGAQDEFYLNVGMRLFHQALEAERIPHQYAEHDGGHFGLDHRLDHSLEAISRAVG